MSPDDLVTSFDGCKTYAPMLACGHYGLSHTPECDIWDKPTEPSYCPHCNSDRYLHADLIRFLLENMDRMVNEVMEDWLRGLRGDGR